MLFGLPVPDLEASEVVPRELGFVSQSGAFELARVADDSRSSRIDGLAATIACEVAIGHGRTLAACHRFGNKWAAPHLAARPSHTEHRPRKQGALRRRRQEPRHSPPRRGMPSHRPWSPPTHRGRNDTHPTVYTHPRTTPNNANPSRDH
jgi:hypothetical protein